MKTEELVQRQAEAVAYADQSDSPEMREALRFAIGIAVEALVSSELESYLASSFRSAKLDMLLYVKLVEHLLSRKEKLDRILSGDFRDDWFGSDTNE